MRFSRLLTSFFLILLCILTIGVVVCKFVLHVNLSVFDPEPYIFLNLMLSTLAGLQGAILLIAAKRQDEISAALAQHDYETNIEAKKDIEEVMRNLARIEDEKLDAILKLLVTPTMKARAKRPTKRSPKRR